MIGYYAHSHGSGHCNYANLFSKVFGRSLTVFTDRNYSFDHGTEVVRLENENPDGTEFCRDDFPEPRALHYAPVNMSKITSRNHTLLGHILRRGISLLIVDVSVEVAMLARVSSVPYAYVRLQGNRVDIPHLNAFEGASFLLAYFPMEMESPDTPKWIIRKTVYLGFLSKFMFDTRLRKRPLEFERDGRPILLHITGFGGTRPFDFKELGEHYTVYGIGPGSVSKYNGVGIENIGIVDDIGPYIEHADIVMAACGSNITSEILSLEKRFLAIPEKRHYREQEYMAENLDRLGWAVDTSKYTGIEEAISVSMALGHTVLPKVSKNGLKAFKAKMDFLGYRADRYILEHHGGTALLPACPRFNHKSIKYHKI